MVKTASQSHFAGTPSADIKRSVFDRKHTVKLPFNASELIPFYCDEVLPGDTFDIKTSFVTRTTTPLVPVMDDMEIEFFYFFCPNRLVWDGWEALHGENESGMWVQAVPPPPIPRINFTGSAGNISVRSIGDYFGLPPYPQYPTNLNINALPFRMYGLIWNEWFRDQNFQAPVPIYTGSGLFETREYLYHPSYLPFKSNKKHDYFSSALPAPQKQANVLIPSTPENTISALRQAFQLQKLFERDARGGTRYTELIRSHFGVVSPDARLQRPEYLGGFKQYINNHQVAQTSATGDMSDTPQGNVAAYSLTNGHHGGIKQSFTEHGFVIGLLTVRSRKTYGRGIERFWFKRERFDYYYPALAHISEQPVYIKELHFGDGVDYSSVWGYQEAWAEYRYKPNRLVGEFRDDLAFWHYGDIYTSQPVLSSSWLVDNTDVNLDRTLAVSKDVAPQFIADILIDNTSTRPLPVYSVPGFADHF